MATTEVSTQATTSLADVGLLILRIGFGATMLQAGLRKAFDFNSAVTFNGIRWLAAAEVRHIHGDDGRRRGA